MKTSIKDLNGRDVDWVYETISSHPEFFGKIEPTDLLHPRFYGVYDSNNKIVAFYGIAYWDNRERVICYIYVKPECRKKGIFTKIVNRTKTDYPKDQIGIWASVDNKLAQEIYSNKFDCLGYDPNEDANYYGIKY